MYIEILELLYAYHGYGITLSTLKRRFKVLGLHKKPLIERPLIERSATVQEVNTTV